VATGARARPTRKKPDPRARLLRLATWLVARGEATREEIYREFAADYTGDAAAREKLWTRDKRDLKKLGIPVVFVEEQGEKGAYVVDAASCTLPRLEFAPEEAAVLWTAGQAALRSHDHPLREDLEMALRKLAVGATGLPPRAAALETDGVPLQPERIRAFLEVLTEAVEARKRVRLLYRKPDGEATERLVDVFGYSWRRGQWIFVGHCHLRGAVRIFLLERVRELALAPARRKGPDYAVPAGFDLRAWSRQEPWDFLVHEPREARVRFRGSLARIAPSLLPGAALSPAGGGARDATLRVRNLEALVRQALAWGPEAELLEPARNADSRLARSISSRPPRP